MKKYKPNKKVWVELISALEAEKEKKRIRHEFYLREKIWGIR